MSSTDAPCVLIVDDEARILSALRRAAGGERVAVLLDGEQRAALDSLPFAQDLEVVYESDPLPAFLACTVGGRLSEHEADELFAALLDLQAQEGGAAVLEQIRLVRFETLTPTQIDAIRGVRERADRVVQAAKECLAALAAPERLFHTRALTGRPRAVGRRLHHREGALRVDGGSGQRPHNESFHVRSHLIIHAAAQATTLRRGHETTCSVFAHTGQCSVGG